LSVDGRQIGAFPFSPLSNERLDIIHRERRGTVPDYADMVADVRENLLQRCCQVVVIVDD
jgi:hypothetical protein